MPTRATKILSCPLAQASRSLIDRDEFYLVAIHVDQIANASADQGTRERRKIGYRTKARISLVLADDPVRLTAVIVANDRDAMAKCDDFHACRLRSQFRARKTFGEIAQVACGEFDRATTLVRIVYELRRLYRSSAIDDRLAQAPEDRTASRDLDA